MAGQDRGDPERAGGEPGAWLTTAGCYLLLFVLGVLQGLIGTFQYSRALGPVPAAAIGFAVLIGLTCAAAAWGMGRATAGLLPAAGWFLTAFLLAMGTAGGSVLITNTSAGEWFLYGGSLCVVAAVFAGFARWSLRRSRARG